MKVHICQAIILITLHNDSIGKITYVRFLKIKIVNKVIG